MTLEAVVYQQDHNNVDNIDLYRLLENWGWDFNLPKQDPQQLQQHTGFSQVETYQYHDHQWDLSPPLMLPSFSNNNTPPPTQPWAATTSTSSTRPKRRRHARTSKKINKDGIESQRMAHIAVERNRRKQMNEYLYEVKSLMPDSYAQRGDQASIVGGAINFVKELEQNLHCLGAKKVQTNNHSSELFGIDGVADVEVTMVDRYANLKIRLSKRPKQLTQMVSGIQSLRLSILHLSISTVDQYALYSLSVKVEDDSKVNSVDEIVTAVHELLGRIEEETRSS